MGETTTQPTAERKYPMKCHMCDAVIPTERKVRVLYHALLRESSFFGGNGLHLLFVLLSRSQRTRTSVPVTKATAVTGGVPLVDVDMSEQMSLTCSLVHCATNVPLLTLMKMK